MWFFSDMFNQDSLKINDDPRRDDDEILAETVIWLAWITYSLISFGSLLTEQRRNTTCRVRCRVLIVKWQYGGFFPLNIIIIN